MSAPPSQRRHARSRRGEETLRQRERHTRLLVRELSHRSKNLLAIIEAMARQTHRTSRSRAEFLERFGARVASLARSHDLLVERNWAGIRLSDLLCAPLKPFVDAESERVATGGPELVLQPAADQNLGMAFHELATNASTHGALSTPSGHIEVAWDLIDDLGGTQRFAGVSTLACRSCRPTAAALARPCWNASCQQAWAVKLTSTGNRRAANGGLLPRSSDHCLVRLLASFAPATGREGMSC